MSLVIRRNLVCLAAMLLASMPVMVDAFIIEPGLEPWLETASGNRTGNGRGGILTWSIVPDGTNVDDGEMSLGGSDLVEYLNETFDGDLDQEDHTLQPWFPLLEDSFGRWAELSGLSFVYEPNDDGVDHSTFDGELGVRGDIRVSGASVDGPGGILAFNFFPQYGGDMTLDTDESGFGNTDGDFRLFRNTVMHEFGHALSLSHVSSNTDELLMGPFTTSTIDGPQLDEIRGIHFYFGDVNEGTNNNTGNGTRRRATELGDLRFDESIVIGTDANISSQRVSADDVDFVSISNNLDVDYYAFSVPEGGELNAELTPLGGEFNQGAEFSRRPQPFDANSRSDLMFSIVDVDGNVLASADETGEGEMESLLMDLLPGDYFAQIRGDAADNVQLYMLSLSLENQSVVGDCNGDGLVDSSDLQCACGSGLLGDIFEVSGSRAGDLDLDGDVDFSDFLGLSSNFGDDGDYTDGDLDCDGAITFPDFLMLAANFSTSADAATHVPEPAGQIWITIVSFVLSACRTRR